MNRSALLPVAVSLTIFGCAMSGAGGGPGGVDGYGEEVTRRIDSLRASAPPYVDITWMSMANVHLQMGDLGMLINGYITRVPASAFYGGGGGLAYTRERYLPDVEGVTRVLNAMGGADNFDLLMTGHSHWDHSFDTATWSKLTGAPIIGSMTTCLQAVAQDVGPERCLPILGGERIPLGSGITMWVIRWNHSGTSSVPEQHDPIELTAVPVIPPGETGMRPGVAEDFPNGGGNRAFLFRFDLPGGQRYSMFFNDSAAPANLHLPIIVDGVDYGAPLDNLRAAMQEAGLDSVNLWIGGGGGAVAELVVPVVKPAAHLPIHFDGLYAPFFGGLPAPLNDRRLTQVLSEAGVELINPIQYMDRWRLSPSGITAIPNDAMKRQLGLQTATP